MSAGAETAETLTPGEQARRAHSVGSAVRDGVLVWFALLGSIGAWTIHLMFLTSFVRFTCTSGDHVWAMHLATLVTLAMCAVAMLLSWRLVRAGGDDASERGWLPFLGRLGLLVGAINVALIAVEGLYVFVLASRRCG